MAEHRESSPLKNVLKTNMIQKLVRSDAHFKHQQFGEPDLDVEEKSKIASDILDKSVAIFLERFSNYLTLEDVEYFSDLKGDYLVDFYLSKVIQRNSSAHQNVVKNRRYQALQELMSDGEYFSMESMQQRDPLLFEQMVGQYETEEEKKERDVDKSDLRFSSILLKYMDKQETKAFYMKLKEREEEQEEEEEDSSDEEDEEIDDDEQRKSDDAKINDDGGDDDDDEEGNTGSQDEDIQMCQASKLQMRSEFIQIMQERFLSGEDSQFDYSKVDTNAEYDSLDILGNDAEEKYFDAEDPADSLGYGDSDAVVGTKMNSEPCQPLRKRIAQLALQKDSNQEVHASDDMDVDFMNYTPSEDLVKQSKEHGSL